MKFKKKTKFISLFLVMPFTMVCPLSISSCNNTPATEDALIIKDPTSKHGEDDIQDDKSANILLPFFSYNIPIDQKKLTVSGSFSYGEAEFKYSIVDFDIFNKTFSVLINIQKIQVVEHLIGKIFFKYNNVDVTSELADFDLSVNPVKSIKLPEVKESLTQIKSGNASVKFQGFQANGIKNVNEILVSFTGTPTLGKVEKCTITDVSNNNFSVAISFSGVAAETIDGYFQFFYESSQVSAPKDNFSCTLLVESGQPDFETDSWWNIIKYANEGLDVLQKHYGIASFVGLKHEIDIATETVVHVQTEKYVVRVIGQNQDHFASGKDIALTFQFETVISEYNDQDVYAVIQKYWDEHSLPKWKWYDPSDGSECTLRSYLRTTFLPKIDKRVGDFIKPAEKITYNGDASNEDEQYIKSRDYIWLLSPSEMGLIPDEESKNSAYSEGECYQYYLKCYGEESSELRIALDKDGNKCKYWCRSPYFYCDDNGEIHQHQHASLCLRPCFCI